MKIIINVLVLFTLLGCNSQPNEKCISDLKEKLQIKNGNRKKEKIINFRDSINCIKWDSVLVIMAAGSRKESVQKRFDIIIPYNYEDRTLNFYGDNDTYIFFVKNKVVINHILLTNSSQSQTYIKYDFLNLMKYTDHAFVAKKDAVFEVYGAEAVSNTGLKYKWDNLIRIKK